MLFDKDGIHFIGTDNYNFKINDNNEIYDKNEALKKGNSFPNLYDEYKNYNPGDLKVKNEREKALLEIQMLDFILTDLNLYLDTHPNDKYVYSLFKKYAEECIRKKDAYTRIYDPLTLDDLTDEWEWSKGVWPWEEGSM